MGNILARCKADTTLSYSFSQMAFMGKQGAPWGPGKTIPPFAAMIGGSFLEQIGPEAQALGSPALLGALVPRESGFLTPSQDAWVSRFWRGRLRARTDDHPPPAPTVWLCVV